MTTPEIIEELRATTQQRPLTVDEYHRMIEAGIIDEDEHVELIEGVLVAMTPQSQPHSRILSRLTNLFVRGLSDDFVVRVQMPVMLDDRSEPEPDFAVVTREEGERRDHPPTSALLLIEVSHSTLRKDRSVKSRLYARSGVCEYWIVNDLDGCIEVHRDPDAKAGTYRTRFLVRDGEKLSPAHLPGPEVDVGALLK